jgi:hypothetical protein
LPTSPAAERISRAGRRIQTRDALDAGVGEQQGRGRRREAGHDAQRQVLAAHENPGGRALRRRGRVVGQVALEVVGHGHQRSDVGGGPVRRVEEGRRHARRGLLGGHRRGLDGGRGVGLAVHHHVASGIQLGEHGDRRREIVSGCRLERHSVHISGDVCRTARARPIRVSGCGDPRLGDGAGHRDRGAFGRKA